MVTILVKHKVKEYNNWKKVYDEHNNFRIKNGMISDNVYKNANDPTEMFMLFKWDNILNARIFLQSEDLKKVMENAGVTNKPEIYFLEETTQSISAKPVMQPLQW